MSIKVRNYAGGRYEVDIRFQLPNGDVFRKRLVAPVTSASAAKRWGEAKERDLFAKAVRGEGDLPKHTKTFKDFAPEFLDRYARGSGQKPSGVESKKTIIDKHLVPRFGSKRLDELTDLDVDRLKSDLSNKKLHPKTINNVLSVLNTMLKVAVRWKEIIEVPVKIDLLRYQEKQMEFYAPDVYVGLVNAAASTSPEDELLVRAGGDAGLRRGEIIGLTDTALDMGRRVLIIHASIVRGEVGATKGLKVRELPMSAGLHALLEGHFKDRRGPLIAQNDGQPVTGKMLRVRMARIQKKAGIVDRGSLHILRHTFCSHLAMGGVPVLEIQRLAGHAHLSTTMRYMHLAPNADLKEAVASLTAVRAKAVSGRAPKFHVVQGGAQPADEAEEVADAQDDESDSALNS